jgi:hypothetical protein
MSELVVSCAPPVNANAANAAASAFTAPGRA